MVETVDTYYGNPNLKRSNVEVNFTEEQVKEYMKCQEDPIYFIQNYIQIVHVDRGLVPFDLYDFQEDMIKTFHDNRFVICKMPRQSGKSTTIIAYLLHYLLFNETVSIALLANKSQTARELLGRLRLAYEHLPRWLQQGILSWNKGSIELENGSKILASATSSSAVRGGTYNIIFLDEFAFVPHNFAEEFFSSVYPTITSGKTTKVFMVSTPNGMNLFYKVWTDAEEKRNSYIPIDVHWTQVPGRDQKWKEETIANTSEDQFRKEFETEFVGSSKTLIGGHKLRSLAYKPPIYSKDGLDVFYKPQKNRAYTLIADVARGAGLDYSAFTIIDHTEMPYKIVAKFRDNEISPLLYPNVIAAAAREYDNASILIENNDVGFQVASILHYDIEYDHMISTSMRGRAGQRVTGGFGRSSALGVKTTQQVKRIGCSNLKTIIEEDKLIIEDFDIIAELTTFCSKGSSYEADEGHHDDLVMTLVLFSWLSTQEYFKELTDINIRKEIYGQQMDDLEADLTPFGIIDDGTNDDSFVDSKGNRWTTVDMNNRGYENPSSPLYWG